MSSITIAVSDPLGAMLAERMKAVGARSEQEYLLGLVEAYCADGELERTLLARWDGPFVPLTAGWQEKVRAAADNRQ